MHKIYLFLATALLAACGPRTARTIPVGADDPSDAVLAKAVRVVPTPQQLHALENGFAAFVHFGPNTFTSVEWGSGLEDPAVFDLQSLDTDQWCRIFRDAGMKRVILTAKHHDGFVLWPSRYTAHGVASSPFRGDVVKELSESCRKYGLEFGFYLSPADLYQMESEDGLYGNGSTATPRTIPRPVEGRPFADKRSFSFTVDDYNEYFLNQLFELLTEYGPVSEVWFDGAHPKRKGGQQYDYLAWKELIHELAPDAVVFGKEDLRWCGNEAGETREAEWNVIPYAQDPAEMNMFDDLTDADLGSRERLLAQPKPFWLHYQPAETDVSIRDGWFWRNDDGQAVRSADNVFDIWERSVGGNSILLLNVPPNRQGRISPRDSTVLAEVGRRIREVYDVDLLSGARRKDTAEGIEFRQFLSVSFDRLELREDLSKGERVEAFALDVWQDGWKEVARGTNIGNRRILRFPQQDAAAVRVRILSARAKPQLSTISAYNTK
ncbi:MAG: alpha-L-fucosidase [Bacteroidales bacterium]|nr:alpha-L-fucosidase [Bacteroidales bacterium]